MIQTRAVLAGAYRQRDPRSTLTHAVIVEHGTGREGTALCGRVKPDSLADEYAQDTSAPPTCKTCLRKLIKIIEVNP